MNKNALVGAAYKRGLSLAQLAAALGMTRQALYRRTAGLSEFRITEVVTIRKLLQLTDAELAEIFFSDVQPRGASHE